MADPNRARPAGPSGRRRADQRDDDLVGGRPGQCMEMIMEANKASRRQLLYLL
jgi:hypothetical protein